MDHTYHNTNSRNCKHLNLKERFYIEIRLKAGVSIPCIAKELGRSKTTIYSEVRRGTVSQQKGKKLTQIYFADAGERVYQENRQGSFNKPKIASVERFLRYAEKQYRTKGWCFDITVKRALKDGLFKRSDIVCAKTLYNYLHNGLLSLKAIDLPMIVRRSTRKTNTRQNKKELGRSIDERDKHVELRNEFGHWEIDTVRGIKNKTDEVLITLVERKTRLYVVIRAKSASSKDILEAMKKWMSKVNYKGMTICKTITSDNGYEFSDLTSLENESLKVYFAHPYSPWERGSNERHNGLLRRFIRKGKAIRDVSYELLQRAMTSINNLPRKILDYATPLERFLEELKFLSV